MKNILLVAVMLVISGCDKDFGKCQGATVSTPPCSVISSPSTNVDIYHNDYCKHLLDVSEYSTGCYFAYESIRLAQRKEAAEYADKMALLRKQEEVPVTCIVEKSE